MSSAQVCFAWLVLRLELARVLESAAASELLWEVPTVWQWSEHRSKVEATDPPKVFRWVQMTVLRCSVPPQSLVPRLAPSWGPPLGPQSEGLWAPQSVPWWEPRTERRSAAPSVPLMAPQSVGL
jgi:hypothetical protein